MFTKLFTKVGHDQLTNQIYFGVTESNIRATVTFNVEIVTDQYFVNALA